jgi:hypothetical protein
MIALFLALKGRYKKKSDQIKVRSNKTCNALSELKNLLDFYPGRCPGLLCCRPFRAKKINIRLYGKRILFTGNVGYTRFI